MDLPKGFPNVVPDFSPHAQADGVSSIRDTSVVEVGIGDGRDRGRRRKSKGLGELDLLLLTGFRFT